MSVYTLLAKRYKNNFHSNSAQNMKMWLPWLLMKNCLRPIHTTPNDLSPTFLAVRAQGGVSLRIILPGLGQAWRCHIRC